MAELVAFYQLLVRERTLGQIDAALLGFAQPGARRLILVPGLSQGRQSGPKMNTIRETKQRMISYQLE